MARPPDERTRARALRAKALRAEGIDIPTIAERLGVSVWTVYPYLRWPGTGAVSPRGQRNKRRQS